MHNHITTWVAASSLLALVACGSGGSTTASSGSASGAAEGSEHKLAELTPDEVEARMAKNDGSFFVFDNNGKEVFDKEHVPSAKWVAFDKVTAADLPADKDATLVFYCMNDH